jgi:hypothetical protein
MAYAYRMIQAWMEFSIVSSGNTSAENFRKYLMDTGRPSLARHARSWMAIMEDD